MWNTLESANIEVKEQIAGNPDFLYMDTDDVMVLDMKFGGYVKNKKIIKNKSNEWIHIEFSNGTKLSCTIDHPLHTANRGTIRADELTQQDTILFHDINETTLDIVEHEIHPIGITKYNKDTFSYDVTTVTDHFTVNGIYSHNCRSFLSAWVDPKTGQKVWESRFNQGCSSMPWTKMRELIWKTLLYKMTIC